MKRATVAYHLTVGVSPGNTEGCAALIRITVRKVPDSRHSGDGSPGNSRNEQARRIRVDRPETGFNQATRVYAWGVRNEMTNSRPYAYEHEYCTYVGKGTGHDRKPADRYRYRYTIGCHRSCRKGCFTHMLYSYGYVFRGRMG